MQSRLFVKNLPVECTEDMLRSHFAPCGNITDVRIIKTKSGKTRQFGFVGFMTEKGKENGLKLDKSFIMTCRIVVNQALKKNSDQLPRPWSRHTDGTSANRRLVKHQTEKRERKDKEKKKKREKDRKRKEQYDKFLKMNETKPIWDNDLLAPVKKKKAPKGKKKKDDDDDVDFEIEPLPTSIVPDERISKSKKMSDLDYLLSKTVDVDEERVKKSMEVEVETREEPDFEEGRLFVRNLSFQCTEDDLQKLFGQFGDLSEVSMPVDKQSKRKTGIAFVTFVIPSNAEKAKDALSGKFYQGRYIHIMNARGKRAVVTEDRFKSIKSSFKRKQAVKRKQSAGSAFNWNTLLIRQDTAIQNVSEQLGIKKTQLLDITQNNMPVRVALAETEAIRQTKEELGILGIDFSQVDRPEHMKKRSRTMILVKNIVASASLWKDLQKMFQKYGDVKRVVVPKIGTMAVVEFAHPSEAKVAFESLAYNKYKSIPLYLEWAPLSKDERITPKPVPVPIPVEMEEDEDDEDDEGQQATLFVKNLSFKVREKDLERLFSRIGKISNCSIPRDKVTKKSRGFGFVTFRNINDSVNAFKRFQNYQLDGKALKIEYKDSSASQSNEKTGRRFNKKKLIVKNLAFEANKKDVQELFGAFGEVKEIRIPRKVAGGHRGFAFVEFVSAQDCANARNSLSSTHLFGRNLVLEHALEDNSVEAIRENMQKDIRKKRKREKVLEKTNFHKRRKMRR